MGPSMDSQIITVLFSDVIKSSEILDDDHEFADKLKGMLEKLPKPEVGKYGQIKEWAVDYDEVEIGHRHISQLFPCIRQTLSRRIKLLSLLMLQEQPL